jgi:hypothetical protein
MASTCPLPGQLLFLEVDPSFVVGSGTSLKRKESQCVLVVRDSGLASELKYLLNGLEANCILYGFAELLVGNLHIARYDGSDKARLGRCDFTRWGPCVPNMCHRCLK